jgi:hypothetical protein
VKENPVELERAGGFHNPRGICDRLIIFLNMRSLSPRPALTEAGLFCISRSFRESLPTWRAASAVWKFTWQSIRGRRRLSVARSDELWAVGESEWQELMEHNSRRSQKG